MLCIGGNVPMMVDRFSLKWYMRGTYDIDVNCYKKLHMLKVTS